MPEVTASLPVISRLPWGLLGFLGLKNGGQFPRNLESNIRTILDQLGFLVANYAEPQFANVSVTGAGSFNLFTVPNGEIWYVERLSYLTSTSAAQTFQGVLTHVYPSGNYSLAISPEVALPISQFGNLRMEFPLWAGPGQLFNLIVHVATGTPIAGTAHARILRMTV